MVAGGLQGRQRVGRGSGKWVVMVWVMMMRVMWMKRFRAAQLDHGGHYAGVMVFGFCFNGYLVFGGGFALGSEAGPCGAGCHTMA